MPLYISNMTLLGSLGKVYEIIGRIKECCAHRQSPGDICSSHWTSQLSIAFDQGHSSIPQLVDHIKRWSKTWSASSRLFEDVWALETDQARNHIIAALCRDLDRVCDIAAREWTTVHRY